MGILIPVALGGDPNGILPGVVHRVEGGAVDAATRAVGPNLAGVPLLPAIIGSELLVFVLALMSGLFVRTRI